MTSLKERAELAGNRYEELKSFEADQEINTGGLSIKSHVKFKKPRKLVVEYDQYRNPFEDFEIQVSGGPEFSGDDLSEARLVYDGRFTWVHLINKDAVYKKEGKGNFNYQLIGPVTKKLSFVTEPQYHQLI